MVARAAGAGSPALATHMASVCGKWHGTWKLGKSKYYRGVVFWEEGDTRAPRNVVSSLLPRLGCERMLNVRVRAPCLRSRRTRETKAHRHLLLGWYYVQPARPALEPARAACLPLCAQALHRHAPNSETRRAPCVTSSAYNVVLECIRARDMKSFCRDTDSYRTDHLP